MKKTTYYIFTLLLILSSCCLKRPDCVSFTQEELNWIPWHLDGDTLTFVNSKDTLDSILILFKVLQQGEDEIIERAGQLCPKKCVTFQHFTYRDISSVQKSTTYFHISKSPKFALHKGDIVFYYSNNNKSDLDLSKEQINFSTKYNTYEKAHELIYTEGNMFYVYNKGIVRIIKNNVGDTLIYDLKN